MTEFNSLYVADGKISLCMQHRLHCSNIVPVVTAVGLSAVVLLRQVATQI